MPQLGRYIVLKSQTKLQAAMHDAPSNCKSNTFAIHSAQATESRD